MANASAKRYVIVVRLSSCSVRGGFTGFGFFAKLYWVLEEMKVIYIKESFYILILTKYVTIGKYD